jgi:hypothetical protein
VIGSLDSGSAAGITAHLAGFHQGLSETGYIEGKNVAIDYRWAQGHCDQLLAPRCRSGAPTGYGDGRHPQHASGDCSKGGVDAPRAGRRGD